MLRKHRIRSHCQGTSIFILGVAGAAAVASVCFQSTAWSWGQASHVHGPKDKRLSSRVRVAATHEKVASTQMREMPKAPKDPLDWSVDDIRNSNFLSSAAYAGSLCRAMEDGCHGDEYEHRLAAMLEHSDGVRGFFVTYLTDPTFEAIADSPEGLPAAISSALCASNPEVVAPLAVMNLAMPTATALRHESEGNSKAAAASALTARRAARVLEVLTSPDAASGPATRATLEAALHAAEKDKEDSDPQWTSFYSRWKYDEEQMTAIRASLDAALTSSPAISK